MSLGLRVYLVRVLCGLPVTPPLCWLCPHGWRVLGWNRSQAGSSQKTASKVKIERTDIACCRWRVLYNLNRNKISNGWERSAVPDRAKVGRGERKKLLTPPRSCGGYREPLYDLWVAYTLLREEGGCFRLVLWKVKPANPLKSYINIRMLLMCSILRWELWEFRSLSVCVCFEPSSRYTTTWKNKLAWLTFPKVNDLEEVLAD